MINVYVTFRYCYRPSDKYAYGLYPYTLIRKDATPHWERSGDSYWIYDHLPLESSNVHKGQDNS